MTDEDTYTYGRTVSAEAFRHIVKALKDNTIGHRAEVVKHMFGRPERVTIYVKPERQRRLDKFVDRFDK